MSIRTRGVSSGGLRGLEYPPKVWHNSQLSSCVTTIVTDKQQLVAKTNNKLTGLALNGSFLSLLGLKQPSLSSSCLQECVNEGRGQRFGGVAKPFASALCTHLAQHLPSSNPGHTPTYHSVNVTKMECLHGNAVFIAVMWSQLRVLMHKK